MINEVKDFSAYTFANGKFSDWFTSDISFARSAGLMSVYGQTKAAPAVVTEANAVRFPASTRAGVLTRAAMVVTGTGAPNPVLRSVRLIRDIMCEKIELPNLATLPPGALAPLQPDPNLSTRTRYEARTAQMYCAGCHTGINPLGFALGNFSGLGFYENIEPLFNVDGSFAKTTPIDAKVNLKGTLGYDAPSNDATELSGLLAHSPKVKGCFTVELARYILSRDPDQTKEGCRLQSVYSKLSDSSDMSDALQSLAQDLDFRMRRMSAGGTP
jgi:hypothetical protein